MRVTVCEMSDEQGDFVRDWERLVAHVRAESSELVVLPEMPFYPWFALTRRVDASVWQEAVAAHDEWNKRLPELAPAIVLCSRPVSAGSRRLNEGFVWEEGRGCRPAHTKYYLPDEKDFWEASWYDRGDGDFSVFHSSKAVVGFLICTEIWFMERGRAYGKQGAHVIATPRAAEKPHVDKWLAGARAAAVISGTFALSSNRSGYDGRTVEWGGLGWIVDPEGRVLAVTSPERPFVTVDVDLADAERARQTYPRYVLE